MQKISVDPDLWARTRRKAFDTQTTASKIVATALVEYLDRVEKPQARVATPKGEEVTLHLASDGGLTLYDGPATFTPERPKEDGPLPWDGPAQLYRDAEGIRRVRGQDALPPPADITVDDIRAADKATEAFTLVKDPKEVEAIMAAKERSFTPVPKPVRKARPKR